MTIKNGQTPKNQPGEFLPLVRKRPGRPTSPMNGGAAIAGRSKTAQRLLTMKRRGKTWEQIADELSNEDDKISAALVWKVAHGRSKSSRLNARFSKPYPHYAKIRLDDIEQVERQLKKHYPGKFTRT